MRIYMDFMTTIELVPLNVTCDCELDVITRVLRPALNIKMGETVFLELVCRWYHVLEDY